MYQKLFNELNNYTNNFNKEELLDYQLLLITTQKITLYFETNPERKSKCSLMEIYDNILQKYQLKKILTIQELNKLFNSPEGTNIEDYDNYLTLFNLIFQEWESEDNIFSFKLKNIFNNIINEITRALDLKEDQENNQLESNQKTSVKSKDEIITFEQLPNFEEFPTFDDFVIKNKNYLKEYIIRKKLMDYSCNRCGLSSWQNNPLMLHLYSKDGKYSNLDLSNLEFLCPNCYSQVGD